MAQRSMEQRAWKDGQTTSIEACLRFFEASVENSRTSY